MEEMLLNCTVDCALRQRKLICICMRLLESKVLRVHSPKKGKISINYKLKCESSCQQRITRCKS